MLPVSLFLGVWAVWRGTAHRRPGTRPKPNQTQRRAWPVSVARRGETESVAHTQGPGAGRRRGSARVREGE